jgi:sigma-B regulation protein RsbU (phosphoserine phosphatase)
VVEQTADAIFITNRKGVIEYANPGFEQMTGFPRDEVLGSNPRIIKSGQMPVEYFETLWKTVLGGEVFKSQTINRRKNGETFIAEQTITPMKAPDGEITHFVSVLKDMTDRIRSQEMETEHRLAGRIQEQLFPRDIPGIPGYDIAGAVFPAKFTSGDYFDFIRLTKHRLGIVVADVCDHSLGSAIVMAKTQAYLRTIMQYESNPRKILGILNRQMHPDMPESMFITMFLAILDPIRHILENANAGNTPTLIFDREGSVLHELRTDGFPVGIFKDMKLKLTDPIPLPEGSVTVLITDGITESFDPHGRQFGLEGLIAVIQKHIRASAGEMIERVREAVQAFSGISETADDQTIIICKRDD